MAEQVRFIEKGIAVLSCVCGAAAAILFCGAAVVYRYAHEQSLGPILIAVAWPALFGLAIWRGVVQSRTRFKVAKRVLVVLLVFLLCVCALGAALLSTGLAIRYSMKPESWRELASRARAETLRVGDREVRYFATGSAQAPRLLFIHGTPGHAGSYLSFLLDPVPGYECVAVDRPGFGGSARGGPLPSFEEQARCLRPLLVEREGKRTILIGHSLGGPIAARLAADAPDHVAGLVILAGSLDPATEEPSWYNLLTDMPGIEMKMPGLYQTANAEIAAARENTRALAGALSKIVCPVHVVHGTADGLVPVSNVQFIESTMTGASVRKTILEGEGHGVHRRRDSVIAAIQDVSSRRAR